MKKLAIFLVLTGVLSFISCNQKKGIANHNFKKFHVEKDKAEIKEHIESIFQAFIDQDIDKIKSTHSTDWTGFKTSSTTLKRGINSYMENVQNALDSFQMTHYQFDDIEIQHYGDLAVVYYLASTGFKLKFLPENDTIYPVKYKSIDIYKREPDGWIQSGSHISSFGGN